MNKTAHRIYLGTMASIVMGVTCYLIYIGSPYYQTAIEERFYHPSHTNLKPSGPLGHGMGIVGTLMMVIGVFGYQARKYMRSLSGIWLLKHWLEFHIFLCTLGPILVLFHTSFKFGGLVSISFWSMVAVVASGVVGRFIYLQIPRTLQGRELSLHEITEMRGEFSVMLEKALGAEKWQQITELINRSGEGNNLFYQFYADWQTKKAIRGQLKRADVGRENLTHVMELVSHELGLRQKIERLHVMQKLFNYWHVIHLPFAIVMLVIMLVHVGITLAFGYRWIF